MEKIKYAMCLVALMSIGFVSCTPPPPKTTPEDKQLNITIVLDLSDRLVDNDQPSHTDRDLAVVHELVELFKADVAKKSALKAKGKFRVVVTPAPSSSNIANLLSGLEYDYETAAINDRKVFYRDMDSVICTSLQEVYAQTIATHNWVGSDIWRFFKYDAKIYLENDSLYRNIFVVLTDGYIYHKNSVIKDKNRYSHLTSSILTPYRKTNYKEMIEKNNFGLITETHFDDDMEVLFLELRPNPNYLVDGDIMDDVLQKWCKEMGVRKTECYQTSPDLNKTSKAIKKFME